MHAPVRRLALLAATACSVVALSACGVTAQPTNSPVRAGQNGSLAALTDKLDSIALDECATRPAATVFQNCSRWVTEISNASVAATGGAPGQPNAQAIRTAATSAGDLVAAFVRGGCVASPSQAAPDPNVCGPALGRIQVALNDLRAALPKATATPAPTTAPG